MTEPTEPACTGVAASWCPRCGDCACPRDERGEHVSTLSPGDYGKDSPACPLHARGSKHAEGPCEHETITRRRGVWHCIGCGADLVVGIGHGAYTGGGRL